MPEIPSRSPLRIKLSLRGFSAFGDEVVAGFAADERDGFALGAWAGDAVEGGGFACVKRGVGIDFPEVFFAQL